MNGNDFSFPKSKTPHVTRNLLQSCWCVFGRCLVAGTVSARTSLSLHQWDFLPESQRSKTYPSSPWKKWNTICPLTQIAPRTIILGLFFGIRFTSCRCFFCQQPTVFLKSWQDLASENYARFLLSSTCCWVHWIRLFWCSLVNMGVALCIEIRWDFVSGITFRKFTSRWFHRSDEAIGQSWHCLVEWSCGIGGFAIT